MSPEKSKTYKFTVETDRGDTNNRHRYEGNTFYYEETNRKLKRLYV
jgi:hypothetical protein